MIQAPCAARPATLAVSILAAGCAQASLAQDLPLWEAGLGATALRFPQYRGSDQMRDMVLPLPYLVYRGDFLRSDRNGVRGVLFDTPSLDLNLSFAAAPPVWSNSSDARAGMPNLRPSVEAGPSLELTLWRGQEPGDRLSLVMPVRAALAIEAPPQSIGWVASPRLNLDLAGRRNLAGWNIGLQTGPLYGDRRQNAYYYSVAPAYATPQRPAYEAPGGYAGWQFTAALSRRFRSVWFGTFLRYDNLGGAVYEDSPLVRSTHGVYAGVGLAAVIRESTERVPRRPDE